MLIDDFFEIIEIEISQAKDKAKTKVKLNANHHIFDGHFPEIPIVPGVCMIQMIKEILTKIVNADLILTTSKIIKFQNLVNPKKNSELFFDYNINHINDNLISINTRIYYENITFCQFKGEFRKLK